MILCPVFFPPSCPLAVFIYMHTTSLRLCQILALTSTLFWCYSSYLLCLWCSSLLLHKFKPESSYTLQKYGGLNVFNRSNSLRANPIHRTLISPSWKIRKKQIFNKTQNPKVTLWRKLSSYLTYPQSPVTLAVDIITATMYWVQWNGYYYLQLGRWENQGSENVGDLFASRKKLASVITLFHLLRACLQSSRSAVPLPSLSSLRSHHMLGMFLSFS